MRTRAERRFNDWHKAIRKRRIDREMCVWSWLTNQPSMYYDNLHQYSKNKIHCSCGMCSRYYKTNNRGRRRKISGNYAPSRNWSRKDRRCIIDMDEMENDYYQGNCD